MLELDRIYLGDSFVLDGEMPDKSVDMILEDMPYGTTACKWDQRVDLEKYWESRKRIIKDNGAIVLTASQPFTSILVVSNLKMFKYEWIWDKIRGVGFQIAKFRPMMRHENILVFYKSKIDYNPIMIKRDKIKKSKCYTSSSSNPLKYNDKIEREYINKYPTSILLFSNASQNNKHHPTQKPVALFEYLIKTYTNEGDLVWDGFAGSGTTGVACINTNRRFICIEKEQEYFEKAEKRISEARAQVRIDF